MAITDVVAGNPILASQLVDTLPTLWTSWTPTLVNLTLGNGSVQAVCRQAGKTVDYRFKFTLGSTSAVGSSPTFTPPTTPDSTYYAADDIVGEAGLLDAATQLYAGITYYTGSAFRPAVIGTSSTYAMKTDLTSTIPFTWGTGDKLTAWGSYITT